MILINACRNDDAYYKVKSFSHFFVSKVFFSFGVDSNDSVDVTNINICDIRSFLWE